MPITLAELAARIDAKLEGEGDIVVRRVGTLERAGPDAVAFLSQARFRPFLKTTQAGAVILAAADAAATTRPKLVHPNPYAAYARAASLLHADAPPAPGIDPTARIAAGAVVDAAASVGAYAVIAARAFVGPRALIGSHVHVGEDATIAEDVRLHPHVTIYPRSIVGARTVVHAGAVLGADGFGMAEENGRWLRIPQIGRVVVGADCEIGANTTIDRGAIDDTVIEDDVKLDNQIQVGHNCRIGAHSAIAGCVGIAGSAVIGRNVRIGGAAMIAGHLTIPDNTVIAGGAIVISSIKASGAYSGSFPLLTHQRWRHVAVELRRLRELAARVAALEQALREQEGGDT
ncbi:MAG: UDP-3-O-(3-hydroxymyristoyl)glucosamine N-acyltransferase [Burkholderiales bacterium]|nr:UDP-3-O-(3-hydroxymyristoyl)glucosamine N-acyltransferase [Burkholderiales bacterium]